MANENSHPDGEELLQIRISGRSILTGMVGVTALAISAAGCFASHAVFPNAWRYATDHMGHSSVAIGVIYAGLSARLATTVFKDRMKTGADEGPAILVTAGLWLAAQAAVQAGVGYGNHQLVVQEQAQEKAQCDRVIQRVRDRGLAFADLTCN